MEHSARFPKNALIKYHHVVGQCDLFCKGQNVLSTRPFGRLSLLHGNIARNVSKILRFVGKGWFGKQK